MTTFGPNPPLAVADGCDDAGLWGGFGPIVATALSPRTGFHLAMYQPFPTEHRPSVPSRS
jgi:hypothetical protein